MRHWTLLLLGCMLTTCATDPSGPSGTEGTNADNTLIETPAMSDSSPMTAPMQVSNGANDNTRSFATSVSGTSSWTTSWSDPRRTANGLDPKLNHRLIGCGGESVLMPANSLLRADGTSATGPVEISWAFAATPFDFFAMGAPTVSDNALLGSGGSFYLNATENGKPLRIADGKPWVASMPAEPATLFPQATMRYFSGDRTPNGDVEWSLVPEELIEIEPVRYRYFAIAQEQMPGRAYFERIDSLARKYPETNNVVHAPSAELAIGRAKTAIARMALSFYRDPRYAGTYVCSLPFVERLALLTKTIYCHVRSSGEVHYIDERGSNDHILRTLKTYADHAGEHLFMADAVLKDDMDRLDAIDGTTPGVTGIHIAELRAACDRFMEQHLELPITIDDHGVDLDLPDAYDFLVRTGLSLEEASNILTDHEDRRTSLGGVIRDKEQVGNDLLSLETIHLEDGRMAVVRKRQVNTVRFSNFGYVNCDRFLRQDISNYVDVFVTIEGDALEDENVCLFFPSINGMMNLQRDLSVRAYRLPTRFFGLPLGLEAHVMVIGKDGDEYHYAFKEVRVERMMNLRLRPMPGSMEAACDHMKAIGS